MTRLAVGGKLGNAGRPPVVLPWALRGRRLARAAIPGMERVRMWRLVTTEERLKSVPQGALFIGDDLVQVKDQACYDGVGGHFGVAAGDVFLGGFRVVPVAVGEAVEGSLHHLLFGRHRRAS